MKAQEVIATSQDDLSLLRQVVPLSPDKGRVIYPSRPNSCFQSPNESARNRLRSEWGIPEDGVLCFTAARLDATGGYQYQLAALRLLRSMPPWSHLCFAWAGAGPAAGELAQAIQRMGAEDRVKLVGPRPDLVHWLDAADIFILPSPPSGVSLAIMDAMAKGLPVIAGRVGGVAEQLGDTGKLLPSPGSDYAGTVNALAATIAAWAEYETMRAR